MFEFNKRIVALEFDQDAILLDTKKQEARECIYVLLESGRLEKLIHQIDKMKTNL